MGLIQIMNTTDNELCPKADVFRNRTSEVPHRSVKHQHCAPLVEDEIRDDGNLNGNPRSMCQFKLRFSQVSLSNGLLSQIVCILSSRSHQF